MLGMNKSIFRRLFFSYLFIILIGLGLVGILTSYLVKESIYNNSEEELVRKAKNVNLLIQDKTQDDNLKDILIFLDKSFDTRIWVFNKEGEIISTSADNEVYVGKSVSESIVNRVLKGENVVSELEFEGLDEPMLSVVVPWGKDDTINGGIVLHSPVVGLNETVSSIREIILLTILIIVLVITALVSYLSWSISRPLSQIDKVAAEIGHGNYKKRIDITSEDEIGDLANTINSMAEKLDRINYEREKLDQIRKDFLANVSHELRTPLTALQGFLEVLQDDLVTDDAARKRYYNVMYDETLHMNILIDDLMDLIKLENKEIILAKQYIDVETFIDKVTFKFRQEIADKGLKFNIDIQKDLPRINADPNRLEQILNNTIKNSIKFTDEGSISVKVSKDGDYILFSISDTGIGISQIDQELVWERFFKVDRGRSKKNKGTGLGLSIVKELVFMHDGKIDLQSELGQGTVLSFWIPIE